MDRFISFAYGVICYAIFVGTICYAVGFVGNFLVPKSMDSAPQGSLGAALAIDLALLGLFAVQHSVMARTAFKRWWTRIVPQQVERSTYVLFSSLALILLFWAWQPLGGVIWSVESQAGRVALYAAFAFGWGLALVTTFLINHFELFGLRQVWLHLRGEQYTKQQFVTPGPYKYIRHPVYLGWLFAVWATPTMTVTHLLFAVGTMGYILVGIRFEERDLEDSFGDYASYKRQVPMLIPGVRKKYRPQPEAARAKAGA